MEYRMEHWRTEMEQPTQIAQTDRRMGLSTDSVEMGSQRLVLIIVLKLID